MSDRSTTDNDRSDMPKAGLTAPGEYTPAGEAQGQISSFSADEVARAFGVEAHRVRTAIQGEFDLGADDPIDSQQAQHLAEVMLADQPQDHQLAALMELGAYTPRPDHDWGTGETAPGEQGDRLEQRGLERDEERG
jgi:hypothetical protein